MLDTNNLRNARLSRVHLIVSCCEHQLSRRMFLFSRTLVFYQNQTRR
ncbi:hypothetical protein BCPG3_048 [Bacillus phage BCPG3]|nr:hypothetical protein BCPG3_048 [Bacillus phage BCPG3]QSJ04578.1 hypothetical protein BCP18_046 [Bacillus phage BCP18]